MTTRSTSTTSASTDARPAFDLSSFANPGKLFETLRLPGLDIGAMIEWQRKDMETLIEANRQAYEGARALVERRNQILQQTFAQWQQMLKDSLSMSTDTPAKQVEAVREGVQQAIANVQELASLEAQARIKAWQVVQERMQENFANLQKLLQPK